MKISVADGDVGYLYDADGEEIKYCIAANTKTGDVITCKDNGKGWVTFEHTKHKTPLVFERDYQNQVMCLPHRLR